MSTECGGKPCKRALLILSVRRPKQLNPLINPRGTSKRNAYVAQSQTYFSSAEMRAACPSSSRREAIACTTPAASELLPE